MRQKTDKKAIGNSSNQPEKERERTFFKIFSIQLSLFHFQITILKVLPVSRSLILERELGLRES
jgi:hypothetical protein